MSHDHSHDRQRVLSQARAKAQSLGSYRETAGYSYAPRPLRIGILMCIWKRHELTDLVLTHYAAMRDALNDRFTLDLLAVGSEGATSRHLAERHGFGYLEHANQPLSRKRQAGLQAMRSPHHDAVVMIDSDDLLNARFFELVGEGIRRGLQFMGLMDFYVLDLLADRMVFWPGYRDARAGEPIGLGRCLSSTLLDRLSWTLWDDGLDRGLDLSMFRRVWPFISRPSTCESAVFRCRHHGIAAVDVKSDVNIWRLDDLERTSECEPIDGTTYLERHFPHGQIQQLSKLGARLRSDAAAEGRV